MVRKFIIIGWMVLTLFIFAGCDKEGVCVKKTGDIVRETRPAQPFHYVEVNDNINVFLTQDTITHEIVVEAGENLIAGISAELDSGRLVLENRNTCNWLRSFEVPVNVYLTFTRLDTIIFQASGDVNCTNTWVNDSIFFNVIEGAGDINLSLNVERSVMHVRYGTVSFDVTGKSNVTFISSQGYGPFRAENLISKFTYVYTFSPNDVYVFASEELGVELGNIGNVYYKGEPKDIDKNIYGNGRLIPF
jgi:hypothetical protein